MNYKLDWSIQDGKLGYDVGRIVVYDGLVERSNGPSRDHNDLIASLSSKYRLDKSDVMSRAYRFYWRPARWGITVSPVRKIDIQWAVGNSSFDAIIDQEFDGRRK